MCRYDWGKINPIISDNYPMVVNLSAASQTLLMAAILFMSDRWRWGEISDAVWDEIDVYISNAEDEIMSSAMLGYIVPKTTGLEDYELLCNGATYQRADYPQLYDKLQNTFKIDADSFYVPDLRNLFIAGASPTYPPGTTGGQARVRLTVAEMPAHTHSETEYSPNVDLEGAGVPDPLAIGLPTLPLAQTGSTGGNQTHENLPPYYTLYYVMVAR